MVKFNDVPEGRVPFVHIEFDTSKANQGPEIQPYKSLTLGQKIAAGTQPELEPIQATNADDVATLFGKGSQIHGMAKSLFDNNKISEAWFCAIDDAGGATKASGTITIAGTPTENGTIYSYIAGRRIATPVTTASTPTSLAAALAATVNAHANIPVTASATLGVVTLTAVNGGTQGNAIDVRENFNAGEVLPAGITFAVVDMASGATDPDFAEFTGILGDEHYNIFAFGWDDSANLALLVTELEERWKPIRQIEAMAFVGTKATHAAAITLGSGLNSGHLSIMPVDASPTPPWEWNSAIAAVVTKGAQSDPARPFQTLPLVGVLAPVRTKRWTFEEADLLLHGGMSTFTVDPFGAVKIGRLITTYQTNLAGADSTALLDVVTPLTLGYIRWSLRTMFATKYPRHKLADDGTNFAPGQPVMTPSLARAELIGAFRDWESIGLVEGAEQFKTDLIVERSTKDPNRLEIQISPDLMNQLRVVGAQISFLL